MNQKRQLPEQVLVSEDVYNLKKVCTSEKKSDFPKQFAKQFSQEISNNNLNISIIEELKPLAKQFSLPEIQQLDINNSNQQYIIIPFSTNDSDNKVYNCEFLLFKSSSLKNASYVQTKEQLLQYLDQQQEKNKNHPYVKFANNSYATQIITKENVKYSCFFKKVAQETKSEEELTNIHLNYLEKQIQFLDTFKEQYYPGLNMEFEDSISKRSALDVKNINFQHIDEELKKIDPMEEKFRYHEVKQSKVVVQQLVEYYCLQFQHYVQPLLSNLSQGLILQRLNKSLDHVSIEKVSYGYAIENLVNAICNIYLNDSSSWNQKQQKINQITNVYYNNQNIDEEQKLQEINLIFYMMASKFCAEICLNQEYSQQACNIIQRIIKINPIYFENQLRLACNLKPLYQDNDDPNYDDLIKERKKLCVKNMPIFFTNSHPIKIIKGAFQYLYDDYGRTFIDCANNVQHVGHNHPKVAKAGCDQIVKFNSNTRFLNPNIIEYAKNLTKTAFHPKLNVCMFVNSGSEANDMALNIARTISDSYEIIIMDHSYHGTTTAVEQISETKFNSKGGHGQQPFIHVVDMPDQYRGKFHYDDPECGEKFALQVKEKIDELKRQGKKPAGFICESMPAVGGMTTLPKNYLKNVYKYIREAGGICIADEVQVGFGRVAKHWWAYELQDVVPDIVVIGKPMGNGHPVAGLVMTEEIAHKFNNGQPYFNTYGGNPVSMKIANEVLNVIEEENMRENAQVVGEFLYQGLMELRNKYAIVGDVRGEGLFIGIELVKDKTTQEPAPKEAEIISNQLKNRGFIMLHEGYLKNVLKIKPSLTYSLENSRDFLRTFEEILQNKQW